MRMKRSLDRLVNGGLTEEDNNTVSEDVLTAGVAPEGTMKGGAREGRVDLPAVTEVSSEHVKGKLLSALRKPGSEMLWNVMQNVDITYGRGVICLRPKNSADHGVIDLEANRRKIEESLAEFQPFELKIAEPDSEKQLDALDEATERIKQIFGDDIVIVKD